MFNFPTGYYWAFRKGSPQPEIIFVYYGKAWEIYKNNNGVLFLKEEPLSEQKWIVDKPVEYEK